MEPKQTDESQTPPQQPPQFVTGSQLHNDLTKPKANYKRSAIQISVVLVLLLIIIAIVLLSKHQK